MRHIKLFEEQYSNQQSKPYWFMYGNYDEVCEILSMFLSKEQYDNFIKTTAIFRELNHQYLDVNGAFVSKFGEDSLDFSFWLCRPDMPIENGKEYYETHHDFIFRGELRIEDNKLIKDTLPADVKKYNL